MIDEAIKTHGLVLGRVILALSLLFSLVFIDYDIAMFEQGQTPFRLLEPYNLLLILRHKVLIIAVYSCLVLTVVLGYLPQITSLILLWFSYSFYHLIAIPDGGDHIHFLLCLLLVPISLTDLRKNEWKNERAFRNLHLEDLRRFTHKAFYFLLRLQVCFIYFDAAIGKIRQPEWMSGSAMYYWLQEGHMGAVAHNWMIVKFLISNNSIVFALTWSVILLELLLSFQIVSRSNRLNITFYFGMLFHILIGLFYGLGSFSLTMIAALVLYLIPENFNLSRRLNELGSQNLARLNGVYKSVNVNNWFKNKR